MDSLVKESRQSEKVLDAVQPGLGTVGMVPALGEPAVGLNALLSFLRGN